MRWAYPGALFPTLSAVRRFYPDAGCCVAEIFNRSTYGANTTLTTTVFCLRLHPAEFRQILNSSSLVASLPDTLYVINFDTISTFVRVFLKATCGIAVQAVEGQLSIYPADQKRTKHTIKRTHLSSDPRCIKTNNYPLSPNFSTFPQGLLRLRVFKLIIYFFS